jgi:hypothetical protein
VVLQDTDDIADRDDHIPDGIGAEHPAATAEMNENPEAGRSGVHPLRRVQAVGNEGVRRFPTADIGRTVNALDPFRMVIRRCPHHEGARSQIRS